MFTEHRSENMFTEHRSEDMFTEHRSENMFTEHRSEDTFTEHRSEDMFTEHRSEDMFTEHRSENMFTEHRSEDTFTEHRAPVTRSEVLYSALLSTCLHMYDTECLGPFKRTAGASVALEPHQETSPVGLTRRCSDPAMLTAQKQEAAFWNQKGFFRGTP
ncbi:hypothetical protein EYF80_041244 [Liparis tanakae]|uniref:Uncharacterized protein n=1 Tax=Liparis tanakae TaxID=230148 RepID=A0A4Z2G4T4_9TELE|nr:hypothetical protein EYF80_041244 [Liparis tanakae]